MGTKKIVSLNRDLHDDNKKMIEDAAAKCGFTVSFFTDREEAAEALEEAEIIYSSNPKVLDHAKNLKWLCSSSAGVDQFIRAGMLERTDILFSNASGAYGVTISEHIVMVALMMMRRMPEYQESMRERGWLRQLPQRSLFGAKVLILGTGSLGSTAAKRIRGFEPAKITGVSRSGRPTPEFDEVFTTDALDGLLPDADLVILCLPDTPDTRGILSAERIGLMRPDAYLVNVGRGSAIDHEALIKALDSGKLAGAALDVYVREPIPADDPIRDAKNLVLTPHIAGDETLAETRRLNAAMFCEDLENYAAGRPLVYAVDRTHGY